jgi:ribosome-binding factor A
MSSLHDSPGKHELKARRLCRQVSEALQTGLTGECGDDLLQQVWVVSVEPAEESSRLIVTVSLPPALDPVKTMLHLEGARGRLRSIVAAAIYRKKVPDLAFRLAGPEEGMKP